MYIYSLWSSVAFFAFMRTFYQKCGFFFKSLIAKKGGGAKRRIRSICSKDVKGVFALRMEQEHAHLVTTNVIKPIKRTNEVLIDLD